MVHMVMEAYGVDDDLNDMWASCDVACNRFHCLMGYGVEKLPGAGNSRFSTYNTRCAM